MKTYEHAKAKLATKSPQTPSTLTTRTPHTALTAANTSRTRTTWKAACGYNLHTNAARHNAKHALLAVGYSEDEAEATLKSTEAHYGFGNPATNF